MPVTIVVFGTLVYYLDCFDGKVWYMERYHSCIRTNPSSLLSWISIQVLYSTYNTCILTISSNF